jgi:hypothetical protein
MPAHGRDDGLKVIAAFACHTDLSPIAKEESRGDNNLMAL